MYRGQLVGYGLKEGRIVSSADGTVGTRRRVAWAGLWLATTIGMSPLTVSAQSSECGSAEVRRSETTGNVPEQWRRNAEARLRCLGYSPREIELAWRHGNEENAGDVLARGTTTTRSLTEVDYFALTANRPLQALTPPEACYGTVDGGTKCLGSYSQYLSVQQGGILRWRQEARTDFGDWLRVEYSFSLWSVGAEVLTVSGSPDTAGPDGVPLRGVYAQCLPASGECVRAEVLTDPSLPPLTDSNASLGLILSDPELIGEFKEGLRRLRAAALQDSLYAPPRRR